MKKAMPWMIATTLALASVVAVGAAQNPKDEVERVEKSIATLNQLTSAPDDGIPQYLLDRAEAIVRELHCDATQSRFQAVDWTAAVPNQACQAVGRCSPRDSIASRRATARRW